MRIFIQGPQQAGKSALLEWLRWRLGNQWVSGLITEEMPSTRSSRVGWKGVDLVSGLAEIMAHIPGGPIDSYIFIDDERGDTYVVDVGAIERILNSAMKNRSRKVFFLGEIGPMQSHSIHFLGVSERLMRYDDHIMTIATLPERKHNYAYRSIFEGYDHALYLDLRRETDDHLRGLLLQLAICQDRIGRLTAVEQCNMYRNIEHAIAHHDFTMTSHIIERALIK